MSGPSFAQTKTPFTHRRFVQSLVDTDPVIME